MTGNKMRFGDVNVALSTVVHRRGSTAHERQDTAELRHRLGNERVQCRNYAYLERDAGVCKYCLNDSRFVILLTVVL